MLNRFKEQSGRRRKLPPANADAQSGWQMHSGPITLEFASGFWQLAQ